MLSVFSPDKNLSQPKELKSALKAKNVGICYAYGRGKDYKLNDFFGLSFLVRRIPLAYALGHFVWGDATGVFVAMLISQIIQTALMLYVFYRVDWTKYALKH